MPCCIEFVKFHLIKKKYMFLVLHLAGNSDWITTKALITQSLTSGLRPHNIVKLFESDMIFHSQLVCK